MLHTKIDLWLKEMKTTTLLYNNQYSNLGINSCLRAGSKTEYLVNYMLWSKIALA